jgi:hypothetical protein
MKIPRKPVCGDRRIVATYSYKSMRSLREPAEDFLERFPVGNVVICDHHFCVGGGPAGLGTNGTPSFVIGLAVGVT